MTLGQMLRWHRGLCSTCADDLWTNVCPEYLEICQEFTEARQIHAGTTAPHTILSVREGTAT